MSYAFEFFPCPFCGNRNPTEERGEGYHTIDCRICGNHAVNSDREHAVYDWNSNYRATGAKWNRFDESDKPTLPPPKTKIYLAAWRYGEGEIFVRMDKWTKWTEKNEDDGKTYSGWDWARGYYPATCTYWMDMQALPFDWDEDILVGRISRLEEELAGTYKPDLGRQK
jgi:hypothetical protein